MTMNIIYRGMDFSYLRPPKRVNDLCHPQNYIMELVDGLPCRRIFYGVDFSVLEQKHISDLKRHLQSHHFQHTYDDVKLLKFCIAGGYNLNRTMEKIHQYETWLRDPQIQTFNVNTLSILQSGAIYSYGRDFYYRPIIIIRAGMIDLTTHTVANYLSAFNALLKPISDYMFVPGKVENWIVIIDCERLPAIPRVSIIDTIEKLTAVYATTLERMYIINSSPLLLQILEQLKQIIPEKTYKKLIILGTRESGNLEKYLHADELEKRFGGKLNNLKEYWPIKSTNRIHYDDATEKFLSETVQEPSQYFSILNDSGFFHELQEEQRRVEQSKCHCSGNSCALF